MFLLIAIGALMLAGAAGTKRKKKSARRPAPGPQPGPQPPVYDEVPEEEEHIDPANPWSPFPNLQELQDALIILGFSVGSKGADGKWGAGTKGGVTDFQIHINDVYGLELREDGEPDPPTRTAIGVGLDLFAVEQWLFPGEAEKGEGIPDDQPPQEAEDLPPPPESGEWYPEDPEEVTWSDRIFVAPDCSRVVKGAFWSSQRLNPRIVQAAKDGGEVFAEDILDAELAQDSPFCLDAGYDQWGEEMKGWYDDWVDLIYQDLELYAENPELIGEAA
jgi:hypothetical protein